MEFMRKLLLLASLLVMTLCMITPSTSHADGELAVRLSFGIANGEVGDIVDVPVQLSECKSVDSVQLDINYDPAALSVVSITPGNLFPVEYCITNVAESGVVRLACACALGLEGDGTLITIRFKILADTGSALTVTSRLGGREVTYIDADVNQLTAYLLIENGGVSVGAGSVPLPAVTPWIPDSPTPIPSPTPTATPETTITITSMEQAETPVPEVPIVSDKDPFAYFIIGGLMIVIIFIVVTAVHLRKERELKKNDRSRKGDR